MSNIEGLQYVADYLDSTRECELLEIIDAQPWLDDLKRRVQHYGYKYDYKARAIDPGMSLGPLPGWAAALAGELHARDLFARIPNQVIVNEYLPGQGIGPHIDCEPCFGDTIASLSLGSGCTMRFERIEDGFKSSLFLERRSLIVLTGEARYDWLHSIGSRRADIHDGQPVERDRRISLTFRNVLVKSS